jgi:hypothetical protein
MGQDSADPYKSVVLVADGDTFEARYVALTLEARGLSVLGPCASAEQAQLALQGGEPIGAAVIGYDWTITAPELLQLVQQFGVPCLLLSSNQATRQAALPPNVALLVKPFAAFQVADWVVGVLPAEPVYS